jgi:putative holliday junction resolvase
MENKYPVLAIDYGEKHFGLAVSDSKGIIATPLDVLHKGKNQDREEVFSNIINFCEEYKVKRIVVGIPQEFEESHKETTEKIFTFIRELKNKVEIPIKTWDESFSTTTAENMLTSSGQNIKHSRNKVDKIAATIFLQEFLNSENTQNEKKS